MAASDTSGGLLRGHGVALALVAIFAGVALAVAYAASDGAIFGMNASSTPAGGLPMNDSSSGGAAVISRDSFDVAESAPVQNASSVSAESNTTLSEEQRRLLAMRDFPWDSVAGGHIASTQDSMDRFRQPVPAEPEVDSLALSDRVVVNVERGIEEVEDEDLDLAEVIDDVIDIEIPIDNDDEEQPEEPEEQEQPPEEDEQEEPPQDDQGDDGGNQTDDGDSSGEGSGDEGSEDDDSSGEGDGGNSTSTDPPEDSGSDGGNSTVSEGG